MPGLVIVSVLALSFELVFGVRDTWVALFGLEGEVSQAILFAVLTSIPLLLALTAVILSNRSSHDRQRIIRNTALTTVVTAIPVGLILAVSAAY
jgi:heme/copper-type cytochrome/quinol oxidase subunit 2